jgi:hypothetical protein
VEGAGQNELQLINQSPDWKCGLMLIVDYGQNLPLAQTWFPSLQRAIVRRTCDFLTSAPALNWARLAANENAATDPKDG